MASSAGADCVFPTACHLMDLGMVAELVNEGHIRGTYEVSYGSPRQRSSPQQLSLCYEAHDPGHAGQLQGKSVMGH